jgi:hypothetical protein
MSAPTLTTGWALCLALAMPLLATAQSQQQVADRHIKEVVVRSEDSRKGANVVRVTTTRYDRRGEVMELIERDERGGVIKWERRGYDRKGREVLMAVLDTAGQETQRTETVYDRWGNAIGTTLTERGRVTERSTTTYDKYNDKQEEKVTDAEGKQLRRTTYVYEGKGMLKKRVVYNAEDKAVYVREFTYTY